MTSTFAAGEKVLLLDSKKRRYLIDLVDDGEFHSHAGFVTHAVDHRRSREGVVVRSTKGSEYTALRPTLEDFVVEMPRGAQVIYPKDLGADLHARRHRTGRAGVRERDRFGRAVDDDAALRRGDRRLRDPRRLRQPGPQERRELPRSGRARALPTSTSPTATRGSTRRMVRSTVWCSTSPNRGRSFPTPRACCLPAACWWRTHRRSPRPPRSARRSRASGSTPAHRGAPPGMAHRGPGRPARSPDGRPHRLPQRRSVPRPQRALTRLVRGATGQPRMEPECGAEALEQIGRVGPRDVRVGVAQIDDSVDPGVDLGGHEVRITVVVEQSARIGRRRRRRAIWNAERPTADGWSPRSSLFENSDAVLPGMIDREPHVGLTVGAERDERVIRRAAGHRRGRRGSSPSSTRSPRAAGVRWSWK